MSRSRESEITFPTVIEPEPGIVARYAALSAPPVFKRDVHGQHWFSRTDVQGFMTLCAQADPWLSLGSSNWCGSKSVAHALTLAERGWHETVPAMLEQVARMEARKTRSLIPVLFFTDEPGTPDIATYLDGEDECFLQTTEGHFDTPAAGRAVRIIMEPCVSSGISTKELVERGALVGAVIKTLEQAGVRVALEFRSLIRPFRVGECQIEVVLKEFGEPFDIRNLAFWLTHPSASRVFTFAAACTPKQDRGGDILWGERTPPDDPDCMYIVRHTTFENQGSIEGWATKALAVAGIQIEGE